MQSPFKIFRKHQKVVLAGLTLMAMIGFGLGDVLQKMGRGGGSQQATKDVVETNIGSLSQMEMQYLIRRRTTLQGFIAAAFQASHPDIAKNRFLSQYYTQAIVSQFGFGGVSRPDLLYAWLHRHEARQMGIVVSDLQIRDYIKRFTENKLSTSRFSEILDQMRLSPIELFDMFREELQGDVAEKMKVPKLLPSPEKFWEYFQQLNTRQKIEVAALPVQDFIGDIADPTEKQVLALFEKHKTDYERAANGEFRPGFRQPRRVKLQYLVLGANAVEDKVEASGPVTDKEVDDYYERNKDKDRRFFEFEAPAPDDTAPLNPEFAPEKGPSLEGGAPQKSDDESDKPGEDAKPQAKDKTDETGGTKDEAEPDKKRSDCSSAAADDDASEEASQAAAKPKPEKPSGKSDKKKAAEGLDAGEKAAARSEADDTDYTPDPPALPEGDDGDTTGAGKPKISGKEPPKIKYKPLDDKLKDQIRDSVINDRRKKLLQAETNKAVEALRELGSKFATSPEIKLNEPKPEQVKILERRSEDELRAIADKLGMRFYKTELVSDVELSEIPGLGKAVELGSAETPRGEMTTIVEQAFGGEALCRVFVAEAPEGTIYICWKVQDSASHIPTLDEPGIREQVVKAWKRIEALPVAKKRADELAERARQKKNDLGAALGSETVTGDPKSLSVTVFESPEFSFYRESSAPDPMRNPRPVVQLGNPIVVNKIGRKFMQTVFEDIDEGDVGVALNDDASVYYVVKVLSRRLADRAVFQELNDKLFDPSSPYMQVAQFELRDSIGDYTRRMDEKYAVKWNDLPTGDMVNPVFDDE